MTQLNETAAFVATMILNSLLVGTVISLGVGLALRLTRDASPRMRYILVVNSFVTAAVLPFLIVTTPSLRIDPLPVLEKSRTEHPLVVGKAITESYSSRPGSTTDPTSSFAEHSGIVDTVTSATRVLSNPPISIGIFSVWLIGLSLLLGREVTGHLGAARARRNWKPANQEIRERMSWPRGIPLFLNQEFGPCAIGVLKPAVVLPSHLIDDLSTNVARQVARHELDHLKWRDPLINSLMRLLRAVLWLNFPLWYLERAAAYEREAAADRAAIQTGSEGPKPDRALEYAATLLSIAKKRSQGNAGRKHIFAATDAIRDPGLETRIRRLLAVSSRPRRAHLFLAALALLASAGALAVLPIAQVSSQRSQTMSDDVDPSKLENNLEADKTQRETLASTPASLSRVVDSLRSGTNKEARMSSSAATIDEESTIPIGTIASAEEVQEPVASPRNLDPFESEMAAVGYKNLSPEQLAQMKAYAVSPMYVAEMADSGYSGLSADMLIRFKWLAVSSAFIREMKTLGYENLSPQTLADFRQVAVSSQYIREMRALISGPITAEQLVSLRLYGASTDFVRQLKGLGYERIGANQLISMRLQGVTVPYIEEMRSRGFKELSLDNLIAMRMGLNN